MKSQNREVNGGHFYDIRQELRLKLKCVGFSSQALSYFEMLLLHTKCFFHSAENLAYCSLRAGIFRCQGNQCRRPSVDMSLVYKNKLTHISKGYEPLGQDKSLVSQTESQRWQKWRYHRRAKCSVNFPEILERASLLGDQARFLWR